MIASSSTGCLKNKVPLFDLMEVEKDCIYKIFSHTVFSESSYFKLKFGIKQSKIRQKFAE